MSITRWDPWTEAMSLREAMDSLLQESVVRPRGMGRGEGRVGGMELALDVEERGDAFVITAAIPGMKPENVDLSVQGDTLQIRAERQEERREEGEDRRWVLREQRYGTFARRLTLPSAVKADQAQAAFQEGMLTITLPKAAEAQTRRIPVTARTPAD